MGLSEILGKLDLGKKIDQFRHVFCSYAFTPFEMLSGIFRLRYSKITIIYFIDRAPEEVADKAQ